MNKFGKAVGGSDSIVITILYILFMGIYCCLMMSDRGELYILGRFFHPTIAMYLGYMLYYGEYFYNYIRIPKDERKHINGTVVSCLTVMLIISVLGAGSIIYSGVKDPPYTVAETFSDGTVILLCERNDHIAGEPQSKLTYLDVYRLKGFKAVKIGKIDETRFSNRCLAEDKYTLDYNEKTKALTVACEYGDYSHGFINLKEEFDTGTLTYEFIIS